MLTEREQVSDLEGILKKEIEIKSSNRYQISKRFLDISGSVLGLVLFILAYLVLIIPYRIGDNKGPILFSQKRLGKNGQVFFIYKFRSMKVNADKILKNDKHLYEKYVNKGYKLDANEDPRITKLGHFIRKTSIDELPQFINVLKGEMSLIGPRPIIEEELLEYKKENCESLFLSMKPGITGVWQTSGRSNVNYPERVYLELSYLSNNSILTDLKIIEKTIWKVIKKEGAY